MNILLLTMEWPPQGCGIGTYMYNLARGLAERGHEVTVVTHDAKPAEISGVEIVRVKVPESKRTLWRKMNRWVTEPYHTWSRWACETVMNLQREKKFDVMETAEYGAWGRHLKGNTVVPVVVRCHCPHRLLWEVLEKKGYEKQRMPLWLRRLDDLERKQALEAGAIVSPSFALASHLSLSWGIPRSRFEVIANPIDSKLFCPDARVVKSKEIVYVGRLDFNKGVFDLAAAIGGLVSRYREITLHFVGMDLDAPECYRDRGIKSSDVIRSIIPRECHDRVTFTDHIPVMKAIEYLRRAMFALVPTRGFESFSYTVVEAMSCECAVVGTHCGGPTEIITHGKDGLLVPPGNVDAMSAAIERLIVDENYARRLGTEARRTVEERYSIPAVLPQIEKLYLKGMNQRDT